MKRITGALVVGAAAAIALSTDIHVLTRSAVTSPATASTEWPTYGHDPGGMRFSPLTQITPENVNRLELAWAYHMRPAGYGTDGDGAAGAGRGAAAGPAADGAAAAQGRGRGGGRGGGGTGFAPSQTTPLVADGVMFITTPYGRVVALDPTTGKEVWVFRLPSGNPSTRGVEYWPGDDRTPPQIVFGTTNARLYSLDAKTVSAARTTPMLGSARKRSDAG
jgi:quinoprotein glucose dehydrogenase